MNNNVILFQFKFFLCLSWLKRKENKIKKTESGENKVKTL